MGLMRTHSLATATCCVLACLLLVHASPQDDVSSTAKLRNDAVSSVPAVADRSSDLKSAWWQAPLQIKWLQEVVIVTLLSIYLSNIWYGRARNSEIAVAFADTFCTEGSLLERNFSQVGARINGAMDLILRESMNKFNIYATGRRYCKSFQATLDLQHRQDLIYMACYLVSPRQDHIDIDIPMNEANMQPLVLVIAAPRLAKELSKSLPDVQSFARPIQVEAKRLPQFPSDKLTVWAESSSTFYDLMTDKVTDLLFGRAAFEEASKYFRYLHFSSENPEGFSKHSLKLSFNLPPKEQMQDLTKVLTAVLHFIDVSKHLLHIYSIYNTLETHVLRQYCGHGSAFSSCDQTKPACQEALLALHSTLVILWSNAFAQQPLACPYRKHRSCCNFSSLSSLMCA